MKINFQKLLTQLETLSREGRDKQVLETLSSLNSAKIPEKLRLNFANIARRNGQPSLALRILRQRFKNSFQYPAKDQEKAEYAVALIELGAMQEANSLLNQCEASQAPEILLYKSFALFTTWQYREAIPLLNQYIEILELNSYAYWVAQVNLAAALVFAAQFKEAIYLLDQILLVSKKSGYSRLIENALEIKSQALFGLENFNEALQTISDSLSLSKVTTTKANLYAQKWRTLIDLNQQGATKNNIEKILRLKKLSQQYNHFETLRECDLYLSLALKDRELFNKVYYGTPFQAYRQNMLNKIDLDWTPSGTYTLQKDLKCNPQWLYEINSLHKEHPGFFRPGDLPLSLLQILTQDFYKPKSLGTLFSELFPGNFFDPDSSPDRVYQLVSRLKDQLQRYKIRIHIPHGSQGYHFNISSQVGLVCHLESKPLSQHEHRLGLLEQQMSSPFKAKQASEALGCSLATAKRLLKEAVEQDQILRLGKGPGTLYKFKNVA